MDSDGDLPVLRQQSCLNYHTHSYPVELLLMTMTLVSSNCVMGLDVISLTENNNIARESAEQDQVARM